MKNEFETITIQGECEMRKLPISHAVYRRYVSDMCELAENDDVEEAHKDADFLLVDFLREIGCSELANAFTNVERWYS
jgi:hypothetical protein